MESDINYSISRFPDGQQNVTLDLEELEGEYLEDNAKINVTIMARVNNWKDLELLTAALACINTSGIFNEKHLYLPYLLGARSDRKFEEGGNNYLRDVIAPAINNLEFDSVTILDPHSDVTEAVIDNIEIVPNTEFIEWVLENVGEDIALICPDAGAQKKMWKLVEDLQLEQGFVTASKHRNVKTGKIIDVTVPLKTDAPQNYLIIDDICDGGRTFIEIAKEIKIHSPSSNIYLAVTHGIFSAGYEELKKHFVQIFCTNSYSDIGDSYSFNGEVRQLHGFIKQHEVI